MITLSEKQRKAGIRGENPEYLAANKRVADAEKNASPFKVWLR